MEYDDEEDGESVDSFEEKYGEKRIQELDEHGKVKKDPDSDSES